MPRDKTRNRNSILDKKVIRKGLSIFKTGNSPYWYARMLVRGERRYITRSTNKTGKIAAKSAAEKLFFALSSGEILQGTPKNRQFQYYADQLMRNQQRVAGKQRAKSYSKNDEQILNRQGDGLFAYFGKMDVAEITTPKIRDI